MSAPSVVQPSVVQAAPTARVGRAGFAFGIAIVALVVAAAVIGNALVPQDPFAQDLGKRLVPPFWMEGSRPEHPLGTDQLGRDSLARLVYGARISLLIGVMTVITSGLIGITLGVLGGFFGGRVDVVMANSTKSSTRPPKKPPSTPSVMPINPDVITVIIPISSEMRAP